MGFSILAKNSSCPGKGKTNYGCWTYGTITKIICK